MERRTVSAHWSAALTVIFLAGVSRWSIAQVEPPRVVPASAPAAEFSAARAVTHLRAFARTPHPVGTKAHDEVRDYILQQLSALGVQPEVQTATVVSPRWGSPYNAATVQNIVARLPGTASTRAVLLSGHYDSVSAGPGASVISTTARISSPFFMVLLLGGMIASTLPPPNSFDISQSEREQDGRKPPDW